MLSTGAIDSYECYVLSSIDRVRKKHFCKGGGDNLYVYLSDPILLYNDC